MKRKYLIVIIGIIIAFVSFALYFINKDNAKPTSKIEGLTFLIKNGTLTKTSATIEIKNNSNFNYTFGEDYTIEKKKFGRWKKNKTVEKDVWWNSVENVISNNEQYEKNINWQNIYGTLEKGNYRLVKEINGTRVAVEFSIE